jgi:hypothetical protein
MAAVLNKGASGSFFSVYATCAKVSKTVDYEIAVQSDPSGFAALNCPAGKSPFGGGLANSSDTVEVKETFPLAAPTNPVGWLGWLEQPVPVDVYAVCGVVAPRLDWAGAGTVDVNVDPHSSASSSVSCPSSSQKPIGGGVYANSDSFYMLESYPSRQSTGATVWTGSAVNDSDFSNSFDIYVICAKVG